MQHIISTIKRIVVRLTGHLPTEDLESLLFQVISRRSTSLKPAEALRFLFRLDARLYSLQGKKSIEFGEGVHPKHRLMKYHEFFIDLEAEYLAFARTHRSHPRVEYRQGDVLQISRFDRFDVVILSNVLEHLTDRSTFLARIRQEVRPKRFLVRVPHFERDWRAPLKKELGVEWRLDPTHETEYTVESFRNEMKSAGLNVESLDSLWGELWAVVVPD